MAAWYFKTKMAIALGLASGWSCATLEHLAHKSFETSARAVYSPTDSADFGDFRLYWDRNDPNLSRSDSNQNGRSDWVDLIGKIALEHGQRYKSLGFALPPLPLGKYQIRVTDLGQAAFAVTDGDYEYGDNPNSSFKELHSWGSHISLPSDPGYWKVQDVESVLRVTMAHEYMHALQFSLEIYEQPWLLEAEATAMETIFYPKIWDNHRYANAWLGSPGEPIDYYTPRDCGGVCAAAGHEYGLWPLFYALYRNDSTLVLLRNQISASGPDLSTGLDRSRQVVDSISRLASFGSLAEVYGALWASSMGLKAEPALDLVLLADTSVKKPVPDQEWRPRSCMDTLWDQSVLKGGGVRILKFGPNLPHCHIVFNSSSGRSMQIYRSEGLEMAESLNSQALNSNWEGATLLVYSQLARNQSSKDWFARLEGTMFHYQGLKLYADVDLELQVYDALGKQLNSAPYLEGQEISLPKGLNYVRFRAGSLVRSFQLTQF